MTTRFSIVMSDKDTKMLKELSRGMHKHSKAELIRKIIRIFCRLKELISENDQLAIVDKEGKVKVIILMDL